jgi:hypothetical protein
MGTKRRTACRLIARAAKNLENEAALYAAEQNDTFRMQQLAVAAEEFVAVVQNIGRANRRNDRTKGTR